MKEGIALYEAKELHEIIYAMLHTQIAFGAYPYKASLPRMEDAAKWFSVSVDTIHATYLKLKKEGYITLTKKAGALVAVQLSQAEQAHHIQMFFSSRRAVYFDLCESRVPVFGELTRLAINSLGQEELKKLEQILCQTDLLFSYKIIQCAILLYGSLHNSLLQRLIWHLCLLYEVPLFSVQETMQLFEEEGGAGQALAEACRNANKAAIWETAAAYHEKIRHAVSNLYACSSFTYTGTNVAIIHWTAYENSSQLCYSLAMELLNDIHRGLYIQHDYLPAPAIIAEKKGVSVITVRRTLTLLKQLGAVRSVNGVGTKVLNAESSAQNCNLAAPIIQKRLLDFVHSLQILSLSCKDCMEKILSDNVQAAVYWDKSLDAVKQSGKYESVVFHSLQVIAMFFNSGLIKMIYEELLQILIWGYPLRGMHGSRKQINLFYLPYIEHLKSSLIKKDQRTLITIFEELLLHELHFAASHLQERSIEGAAALVLPDAGRSTNMQK